MSRPRIGSMFSGIDGMGLGVLAALGGEVVWHCEMDPAASDVLARWWPGVPNHGDVTKVDWSQVEPVDLLIGGPPCQAVSSAGRRLGSADPRWMWPEALRAMRELRPAVCLWENPSALLTGKDQEDEDDAPDGDHGPRGVGGPAVDPGWFGWILGEMAEAGFDARWTCVRSSDVGAPHRRDRLFLAAYTGGSGAGWDVGGLPVQARQGGRPVVDVRAALDGGAGAPVDLLPTPAARDGERWGILSAATAAARVANPMRSVNLEDAVALLPTPTVGDSKAAANATAGRLDPDSKHHVGTTLTDVARLLPTPTANPTSGNGHARFLGREATPERWGKYAAAVARWEHLTGERAPGPRDDKGRLHADLPRWMMGFPAGWLDGLRRTAALRCAGNSCQPQVAEVAASLLLAPLGAVS